ncbi:arsenic resistance protein [Paenibacillus sp. NPDC058071]|uniref:arsenic resistance protein n=1 Tax=Paenibacillus sp. NPDC058071 TaxID=3346326 RepID=UPI0036DC4B08
MTRETMERRQVPIYIATLLVAAGVGLLLPEFFANAESGITFVLAVLMYGMFSQIPFLRLKEALANKRFIAVLLLVQYAVVPAVVYGLTRFLPTDSPLLLGVLLVLLAPCIDYVIVFTQLGKGNERLMLVSTPILFVTQLVALPFYLWLFMGKEAAKLFSAGPIAEAFVLIIVLPLALALLAQLWASRTPNAGGQWLEISAWLPVPLMALTLFLMVATQIGKLHDSWSLVAQTVPLYIAFMAIMPFVARFAGRLARLDDGAGRALVFSAGTRNSLVVLPLALALPASESSLVAAVIVTQTIVEIVAELVYIRWIPRKIWPDRT